MTKVLILAYHFHPSEAVAARRATAYAKHLYHYGIHPTIITHQYNEAGKIITQNNPPKVENHKHYKLIRLAQHPSTQTQWLHSSKKSTFFRKFVLIIQWAFGVLDVAGQNDHSYWRFKEFLFPHVKTTHYDYCIGIFNPHFTLKLAYCLNKKFNLPYVLDFRDLWSDHLFKSNPKLTFAEKIQDYITRWYWKKWIRQSKSYSITSEEWLSILNKMSGKSGHVIRNGFEDELLTIKADKTSYFSVGCMGTFYKNQDLETFLFGLRQFLESLDHQNKKHIKLSCLGLSTNYRSQIQKEITDIISTENVEFLPRTDGLRAFEFCKSQTILWHPTFPDADGWFSAKLYDYIASQTTLVCCPADGGIVERTLGVFSHVHFVNSSEDAKEILSHLFNKWSSGARLVMPSNEKSQLKKFTRSGQAKQMAELILSDE